MNAASGQHPPPHTEAPEALIARLGTDPAHGLGEDDAAKRLAKDGPNELPKPKGKSPWIQLVTQFANPIVLTLLVAAIIAARAGWSLCRCGFVTASPGNEA